MGSTNGGGSARQVASPAASRYGVAGAPGAAGSKFSRARNGRLPDGHPETSTYGPAGELAWRSTSISVIAWLIPLASAAGMGRSTIELNAGSSDGPTWATSNTCAADPGIVRTTSSSPDAAPFTR
jgi:hypothetical protein